MYNISTLSKYSFKPDIGLLVDDLDKIVRTSPSELKEGISKVFNPNELQVYSTFPIRVISKTDEVLEFVEYFFQGTQFNIEIIKNPFSPINAFDLLAPINVYFAEEKESPSIIEQTIKYLSNRALLTYIIDQDDTSKIKYDNSFVIKMSLEEIKSFNSFESLLQNHGVLKQLDYYAAFSKLYPVNNFVSEIENLINDTLVRLDIYSRKYSYMENELKENRDKLQWDQRDLNEKLKKAFNKHIIDIDKNKKKIIDYSINQFIPDDNNFSYKINILDNKKVVYPDRSTINRFNSSLVDSYAKIKSFFEVKNKDFIRDLKLGLLKGITTSHIHIFESENSIIESKFSDQDYFEEISKKGVFEYFYKIYRPIFIVLMIISLGPRLLGDRVSFIKELSLPPWAVPIIVMCFLVSAWYSLMKAKKQERWERDNKIQSLKKKMLREYFQFFEKEAQKIFEEYKYYHNEIKDQIEMGAQIYFQKMQETDQNAKKSEIWILENRKKHNDTYKREITRLKEYLDRIKQNVNLFGQYLKEGIKIEQQ